jgi:hypothetical protein
MRTLGKRVSQGIYDYLCECKCTIAINVVSILVEYVKECHQVASNTKTIWKGCLDNLDASRL